MKTIKILVALLAVLPFLFSCEKYEDPINNYDYTAVYFATQRPIRTMVARDEMKFEFGVAIGGLRENTSAQTAEYVIDAELLGTVEGADGFTLLPADYYSLSDPNTLTIEKGSFIGVSTITFDREKFTSDPLAVGENYALPVRVTSTSADSVLVGHDYSIIVVKYISPYHGTYYAKGTQYELSATGDVVEETVYDNADLSQNKTKSFTTKSLNTITTSGIASTLDGSFDLTINSDNSVDITSTDVAITESSCSYSPDDNTIMLDYTFNLNGTTYRSVETLILRQAPELDLRFEEW